MNICTSYKCIILLKVDNLTDLYSGFISFMHKNCIFMQWLKMYTPTSGCTVPLLNMRFAQVVGFSLFRHKKKRQELLPAAVSSYSILKT